MQYYKRLFEVDPWKIKTNVLDVKNRRLQESITSLGNGYMGMRGNFEESYGADHHQGTYIAGVWFPDKTRVGWWKNGYPEYFGKVINATNFIAMDIFVNQTQLDLSVAKLEEFYLELDMKNGVLTRSFVIDVEGSVLKFNFKRFLSIVDRRMCYIDLDIEYLSGVGADIKIISRQDAHVLNEDSNYDELFWDHIDSRVSKDESCLTVRTIPNDFGIEQFSVTSAQSHVTNMEYKESRAGDLFVEDEYGICLNADVNKAHMTKYVSVITSRDVEESNQLDVAHDVLISNKISFVEAMELQSQAWKNRWDLCDIKIDGDDEAQQGIRFNLFQLFQTYYGEDDRLNIGPKGFTGEKYGGATYWDTEAYAVPLYLALADPEVSLNLLKYRYNQLPQAKHNARQQGLAGALYPMVTFTGVECHNEWEITFEEIHRNGAIPYAIYNYTNYTGDESYIKNEGMEVLVEVARFWADRVHFSKRNNMYMIHGVTGPNEYENNVNNNWYTNTLAAWVLQYTHDSYIKYQNDTKVKVEDDELDSWERIYNNMYLPYDEEMGVFVQHDTFLDKDIMKVSDLDPKNLPLNQNWSWDKILRSCFIKQADVLQGIYFFDNKYTIEQKKRNFDFYEPMCVHESSLSPCIHSIIASEIGEHDKAYEMYQRTARLDLDNYNNDTKDGLHITSMTGSWLAIVQGFAQMKTFDNKLSFAPFLPEKWDSYSFRINYRGRLLELKVDCNNTYIKLVSGNPLEMEIYGDKILLSDKQVVSIK